LEARRLELTISCPHCFHPSKPFVVSAKASIDEPQHEIRLQCPMKKCGKEFDYKPGMEVA